MEADEKVRLNDIVNIKLYKVLNLFIVRPFQYIKTSDIG